MISSPPTGSSASSAIRTNTAYTPWCAMKWVSWLVTLASGMSGRRYSRGMNTA
jgi:hypothetical protein